MCDIWTQNTAIELIPHYRAGLLQNLSKYQVVNFQRTENPWNKFIETFKINGSYYALTSTDSTASEAMFATVMFFNPKLLKRYGVTEDLFALQESGNWTWDKFEEICKKFNSNAGKAGLTAFYDSDLYLHKALLYTYGSDWIVNKNGSYTFNGNDKNAQAALTQYKEWADDGTIKVKSGLPLLQFMTSPDYNFFTGNSVFTIALVTNME